MNHGRSFARTVEVRPKKVFSVQYRCGADLLQYEVSNAVEMIKYI